MLFILPSSHPPTSLCRSRSSVVERASCPGLQTRSLATGDGSSNARTVEGDTWGARRVLLLHNPPGRRKSGVARNQMQSPEDESNEVMMSTPEVEPIRTYRVTRLLDGISVRTSTLVAGGREGFSTGHGSLFAVALVTGTGLAVSGVSGPRNLKKAKRIQVQV